MTDKKISQLTNILGSNVDDTNDELAIVDASSNETKAITRAELMSSVYTMSIDNDFAVDTDTLYVDSANDLVGIGTSSPNRSLHISSRSNNLALFESTDAFSFVQFTDNSTSTNPPQIGGLGDDLLFRTQNIERMRIDSSGNVGIGTSSPSSALDVQGDVGVSGGIYLGGTGSTNRLDDYEEGTWGGSASLVSTNTNATSISIFAGTYQRIGDRVTVEGIVILTGDDFSSAGDFVLFGGLPFTAEAYGNSRSPSVGSCGSGRRPLSNRNGNGSARVQESTDSVNLVLTSEPTGSPVGSDGQIAFTISYLVT